MAPRIPLAGHLARDPQMRTGWAAAGNSRTDDPNGQRAQASR